MKFTLIVFAITLIISLESYSISSSVSTCITYESSSSYKWCRYYTSTSSGYACDATDYSSTCGGSSYYRCSNSGSSYLPQNSKKLLCPTDYSNCYSQTAYLYSSTDYGTLFSNYFSTSTLCWYRFIPYSSSIRSITVKLNSLSNANAEVYYESSTNTFSYQGSLSSGSSMNVEVSYYSPVWILISPSSSFAYASITGTASSSSSSSSSNSILVAILVPIFVGGGFIVFVIVCIIVCRAVQRSRVAAAQNNIGAAQAYPVSQAHAPQIFYPQQQSFNQPYVNSTEGMMLSPSNPYTPSLQMQQNIYVLDPVPSQPPQILPAQQMIYMPADQGAHPAYISPGIPVQQAKYPPAY